MTQQNKAFEILARVTNNYNTQTFIKIKKILPMNTVLYVETCEFMLKYNNHQLPLILKTFFQKVDIVHTRYKGSSIKPNEMYEGRLKSS